MESRPKEVHVINRMELPFGGSENRSIELTNLCSSVTNSYLWSEYPGDPQFYRKAGVRMIRPWHLQFPRFGHLMFVGTYYWVGNWLRYSFPKNIVIVHNMPEQDMLWTFLKRLKEIGPRCPISIAYTSKWISDQIGLPGRVFPSPIDIKRFQPSRATEHRPFTIGRLSRDRIEKHHKEDIDLYKDLAKTGVKIRIMGGISLEPYLRGIDGIELLPAGAEFAEDFLKSLDVFYYRTTPEWFEPFGRVVAEAMACGLPVVCGENGGYGEIIKHTVSGYLFSSSDEAYSLLCNLRYDFATREAVGKNARLVIENIYSNSALAEQINFVLSGDPTFDISSIFKPNNKWGISI